MAYSEGQLNGAADYRVGLEIVYSGVQNYGTNQSRFDWNVYLQNPTSYGSYNNDDNQGWSVSIGGVPGSGTFKLDFGFRYTTSRIIGSGQTWISHDSEGHRAAFNSSAYIDTNHGNVGDGGSGDAAVGAPRIPKTPLAGGTPSVSELKPTSAKLSWTASADNRGAGIDQYLLRVNTSSPADGAGFTDYPLGGSVLSHTLTGLPPGTQYYAVVYAHNSQGYSPKSGQLAFKTLSGAYVWDGAEWRPTEVLVWDGDSWNPAEIQVRTSTAWVAAS